MTQLSSQEIDVARYVRDNPYCDRKSIAARFPELTGLDPVLEKLLEEMFLIELAGPMESSLESRVPRKVYLVNPEKNF